MELEQFFVFPIQAKLTSEKRRAVESQIEENATVFGREISYKWLKRGEERFLRILAAPVTIEVVFFDDRIELFGAAPAWARVLFTKGRKQDIKERLEQVLVSVGFVAKSEA
jgi:hypothetical protein